MTFSACRSWPVRLIVSVSLTPRTVPCFLNQAAVCTADFAGVKGEVLSVRNQYRVGRVERAKTKSQATPLFTSCMSAGLHAPSVRARLQLIQKRFENSHPAWTSGRVAPAEDQRKLGLQVRNTHRELPILSKKVSIRCRSTVLWSRVHSVL